MARRVAVLLLLAAAGCLGAKSDSVLHATFINDDQREGRLRVLVDGARAFSVDVVPQGVHPDVWDLGTVRVAGETVALTVSWEGAGDGLSEDFDMTGTSAYLTIVANGGGFTARVESEQPLYL